MMRILNISAFVIVLSITNDYATAQTANHNNHQQGDTAERVNAEVAPSHSHHSASQTEPEHTGHAEHSDHAQHSDHGTESAHEHGGIETSVIPAQHAEVDHSAMDHAAMEHTAMDMSVLEEVSLRDPHAYSGGYERNTGPYTLQPENQIRLADEAIFAGLWVDRFEYAESHDVDATEFEGHAWIGDSYNRTLLRSEIEIVNDSLETAELDLLHMRAISPFWNLQFGARREFGEDVDRNWLSIGLSGLAPYWFEVDASLFVGEKGNSLLDIEAEYDLLLTQRLVVQPRIDVHSYGKTDVEAGHGSGLSRVIAGFRMRYEFSRQITPYIGVERVMKFGKTADLLPFGEDSKDTHWIAGLRFWF